LDDPFSHILTGTPLGPYDRQSAVMTLTPPVEWYLDEDGKAYHCRVSLPGVDPAEINVQVEGQVLSVSAERKPVQARELKVMQSEMWYGTFQRTLKVPESVNLEQIKADYKNGVLEISAPLKASALPRRIEVQTASETPHITS
jgi:HSP20 family protein